MDQEKKRKTRGSIAPGLAIFGCMATGTLACLGGVMGMFSHQALGAGVCFIAAAFAFGIVVHISFSE